VPTRQACASLAYYFVTATQDLAEDLDLQRVLGEADDVQCDQGLAAHCVDIGQGVGGCDATEVDRVIDDGGKEVDRLDEGKVIAQADDCCVVGMVEADE